MKATEVTVYYDDTSEPTNPGWVVSYRDANGYECHDALDETDPHCWGCAVEEACRILQVPASDVVVDGIGSADPAVRAIATIRDVAEKIRCLKSGAGIDLTTWASRLGEAAQELEHDRD